MNPTPKSQNRKPACWVGVPSISQPGTYAQQQAAIACYLRLPRYYRTRDPDGAWLFARAQHIPHVARHLGMEAS